MRLQPQHARDRALVRRRRAWRDEPRSARRHVPIAAGRDARGARRALPRRRHVDAPAGGFYVWVTLPRVLRLAGDARRRRRAPRRLRARDRLLPRRPGADRMRLAFCYPTEERIEEGVRRLGELLARRGGAVPEPGAAMRIAVLAGGRTPERDVSLRGGHRVMTALTSSGTTPGSSTPPRSRSSKPSPGATSRPVLARAPRQGGRGRHRPAPARAPRDPVHGDGAVRLRDRVRQGPREGRPRRAPASRRPRGSSIEGSGPARPRGGCALGDAGRARRPPRAS